MKIINSIVIPIAFCILIQVVTFNANANTLLSKNCVVNILNRTIQVSSDGGWSLPNVPSNIGAVRARATCINDDGTTTSGQSDYFTIETNGITRVSDIVFEELDPVPTSLSYSSSEFIELSSIGETTQLSVIAIFMLTALRNFKCMPPRLQ